MANITRYDPFEDTFDDLFRGFLMRPLRPDARQQQLQLKVDITENDHAYIVHAEIPGVNKDDINVAIHGNQISISAEVQKEREAKEGEKTLHSERYFGKVYRSFSLGQEVDEGAAQAKYHNGVLELTLPKKASTMAKKLTIQ